MKYAWKQYFAKLISNEPCIKMFIYTWKPIWLREWASEEAICKYIHDYNFSESIIEFVQSYIISSYY